MKNTVESPNCILDCANCNTFGLLDCGSGSQSCALLCPYFSRLIVSQYQLLPSLVVTLTIITLVGIVGL